MDGFTADWAGAFASAVDARVTQAVGGCGTTELGALLTCLSFRQLGVGELGEVLGLTGSGSVRLVDRLEREGLVFRQARQGRSVTIRLSGRGRRLAVDLQRRRLAAIGELLAPLTAKEQALLTGLLDKMLHGAGLDAPEARRVCRLCDHRRCDGSACPIGRSLRQHDEPAARAVPGAR
jgi:MarR family transcriptional regulator, negative regulator of the multidrug operon emrRAB